MFADKKSQVQRHQHLARGHTASSDPASSRSSSDFASSPVRPAPGETPRWSGVSDAGGPLASRDWPPLCSSFLQLHGGRANQFRDSGASAWFLGSWRGTLGWQIRQPPKYYKQLLLITGPASFPLSAHNPTRNRGTDNDDVGGNFQFQAVECQLCLKGWAPSVTWSPRGTAISGAFGDQTLLTKWSLGPPAPHLRGQEGGAENTRGWRTGGSPAFVRESRAVSPGSLGL